MRTNRLAAVLALAVTTAVSAVASTPAHSYSGERFFSPWIAAGLSSDGSTALVSEPLPTPPGTPVAHRYTIVDTATGNTLKELPAAVDQEWDVGGGVSQRFLPRITGDGSVVFATTAPLVAADTDATVDLYRYSRTADAPVLLTTSAQLPAGWSILGRVFDASNDGRYVAFPVVRQLNITPSDLEAVQVAVLDSATQEVRLAYGKVTLSVTRALRVAAGLSGDGRILYFTSGEQTIPATTGAPALTHLRRYDWATKSSALIAYDVVPVAAAVSADGRYVAFESVRNPAPGAASGQRSLYTYNHASKGFKLVAAGALAPSIGGTVSKNGRYVAFTRSVGGYAVGFVRDMTLARDVDLGQPDLPAVANGAGHSLVADTGSVAVGYTAATNVDLAGNIAGSFVAVLSPRPGESVRLVDTRGKGRTIDGIDQGGGALPAGSTTVYELAGRGGLPQKPVALVLTATAVSPKGSGYLTVHPCVTPPPVASTINFRLDVTRANTVISPLSDGRVCVTTFGAATDFVLDVSDALEPPSTFAALPPVRLLDTRPGGVTIDGVAQGAGLRPANSVTTVRLRGRGAVPLNAGAVAVNVTVIAAQPGSVMIWNCAAVPQAATVAFAGGNVPTPSFAIIAANTSNDVCVSTTTPAHVIIDAAGSWPVGSELRPRAGSPRLLDTRRTGDTADHKERRIGRRAAGSTYELKVGKRVGIPANGVKVALNVVALDPSTAGFISVYPCGVPRPIASTLNLAAHRSANNVAWVDVPANSKVCIYTSTAVELLAELEATA